MEKRRRLGYIVMARHLQKNAVSPDRRREFLQACKMIGETSIPREDLPRVIAILKVVKVSDCGLKAELNAAIAELEARPGGATSDAKQVALMLAGGAPHHPSLEWEGF